MYIPIYKHCTLSKAAQLNNHLKSSFPLRTHITTPTSAATNQATIATLPESSFNPKAPATAPEGKDVAVAETVTLAGTIVADGTGALAPFCSIAVLERLAKPTEGGS